MDARLQALIDAHVLTTEMIEACQPRLGESQVEAILREGTLAEATYLQIISQASGILAYDLYQGSPYVPVDFPPWIWNEYLALPLAEEEKKLVIGVADPFDKVALDNLHFILGQELKPMVVSPRALRLALRLLAPSAQGNLPRKPTEAASVSSGAQEDFHVAPGNREADGDVDIDSLLKELNQEMEDGQPQDQSKTEKGRSCGVQDFLNAWEILPAGQNEDESAPTIVLTNHLLQWGKEVGASELYLEPTGQGLRIRARTYTDGGWVFPRENLIPKTLQNSVIARIKILAYLDIAERRLPQDGTVYLAADGTIVHLEDGHHATTLHTPISVHLLPTQHGEEVCIRYLPPACVPLHYDELGIPLAIDEQLSIVMRPNEGLILAVGPARHGISTTLYALAERFLLPHKKLVTAEYTIERSLSGASQIQINTTIGMSHSTIVRAALRHNPDALLISEISDYETAELALKAANQGVLVLARLRVGTALGVFLRLIDMGLEPFLVSSLVRAVLDQRLVRLLCPDCKIATPNSPYPFRAGGCKACHAKGFRERRAIFHAIFPDPPFQRLLQHRANYEELKNHLQKLPLAGPRTAALALARQGLTTPEEALSISREPYDDWDAPTI